MLRELSTKGGANAPANNGFGKVVKEWSILGKRILRNEEPASF